jgi:5-methylthioadenosine/S-adenosylhomocysteine deaminase
MNILIKNIDIITEDDANPFIKNGNIGIKGNCIEFVGTNGEIPEAFSADRIVDGRHRLAMPGLVNAHTHCAMTLLRNFADDLALEEWLYNNIFPVENKLTEDDVYWGALLGIAEMIKSGTTSFADMYLHMDSVAEAVCESGIRANLSRSPMHFNAAETPERIDDTEGCLQYYRNWNNREQGRIKVYLEVHSVYLYDEEWLKKSAAIARQLDTGIHIHILETLTEREESIKMYGRDSAQVCAVPEMIKGNFFPVFSKARWIPKKPAFTFNKSWLVSSNNKSTFPSIKPIACSS